MIKIISFDLDGTLVKTTYADFVWLEGLPTVYAREKGVPFETAKHVLRQAYDAIGDTRKEWYNLAYWYDRFQLTSNWRNLLEQYRYVIDAFPEARGVIQRLSKHYDLVIISNAKREFIDHELRETQLDDYFSAVFSSTSDFHMVKKVADFYVAVCQSLDIHPSEMIHVGDHKVYDYQVPKKIGIHAFYLRRNKSNKGESTVSHLKEFELRIKKEKRCYSSHSTNIL